MSTDDLKKAVYVTAVVVVASLALQVWLLDGLTISARTLQRVPTAVTITVVFWLLIAKWGWKQWPIRLLLQRPCVAGTWVGHLQSNWRRTGKLTGPFSVPIVFVIEQDFFSMSIRSFTADREGTSEAVRLAVKRPLAVTSLSYFYALREEFRAGEGYQQGAAELRLAGEGVRELRGEYWTNMESGGRLLLRRRSNRPVHSFREASDQWPVVQWQGF